MKIEMRDIKTGISVFLCIVISKLFKLQYPFFVAIAAIMPLQNSVSETFKAGKNRMFGTIVGAFIGVLLYLIKPGSASLCGIGMIIVIFFCKLLAWNSSTSIAGLVFIAIMVTLKNASPWVYSVSRVLDTLIGISIAMVVNYIILPPNFMNEMYKRLNELREFALSLIQEKVYLNNLIDFKSFNLSILDLENELDSYAKEHRVSSKNALKIDDVRKILNLFKDTYEHLKVICSLENTYELDESNYKNVTELFKKKIEYINYRDTRTNIVFNYHLSKLIDNLNNLNFFLSSHFTQISK